MVLFKAANFMTDGTHDFIENFVWDNSLPLSAAPPAFPFDQLGLTV